jgi:predicted Zn-dependent protease
MYNTLRLTPFALIFFLNSCSPILLGVPTVVDEKLERYVTEVGLEIVAVSEHRDRRANYQFRLADFARRDILGLSIGKQRIFISYELSRLAYQNRDYRWLLRHTLAHEIAHDVLGKGPATREEAGDHKIGLANRITGGDLGLSSRIKFLPYSRTAELAADRRAMEYWHKLGWDCRHWVRLFMDFTEQGYEGDVDHPTKERLEQSMQICSEVSMASAAAY